MYDNQQNTTKNTCARALLAAAILVFISAFGTQTMAEGIPLSGQLELGGDVDRHGRPRAGSSRFHFTVSGAAAKAMYESLSETAKKDDCSGFIRKSEGNVNCYAKSIQQEYSCTFAINIEQSRLEPSAATCR